MEGWLREVCLTQDGLGYRFIYGPGGVKGMEQPSPSKEVCLKLWEQHVCLLSHNLSHASFQNLLYGRLYCQNCRLIRLLNRVPNRRHIQDIFRILRLTTTIFVIIEETAVTLL